MRAFEFILKRMIQESTPTAGDSVNQFFKDIENGSIDPNIVNDALQKIDELVNQEEPLKNQNPSVPTTEALVYSKKNADELRKVLMKQGATSQEIMDIITFAYRQNIVKNCRTLMATKLYKQEAADLLAVLFYELPATFHQRNNLSNALIKTGILNLEKLKKPGKGSLTDLLLDAYKSDKAAINLFSKLKIKERFSYPS
jgi:hypothetical protein